MKNQAIASTDVEAFEAIDSSLLGRVTGGSNVDCGGATYSTPSAPTPAQIESAKKKVTDRARELVLDANPALAPVRGAAAIYNGASDGTAY